MNTPGPWLRNIRCEGKYPTVFAGRNTHVAHVCQQKTGAETEANIDLVAAAPDLLAACIYCEQVLDTLMDESVLASDRAMTRIALLDMLEAAIPKSLRP